MVVACAACGSLGSAFVGRGCRWYCRRRAADADWPRYSEPSPKGRKPPPVAREACRHSVPAPVGAAGGTATWGCWPCRMLWVMGVGQGYDAMIACQLCGATAHAVTWGVGRGLARNQRALARAAEYYAREDRRGADVS